MKDLMSAEADLRLLHLGCCSSPRSASGQLKLHFSQSLMIGVPENEYKVLYLYNVFFRNNRNNTKLI